jgi:hypothetical protein
MANTFARRILADGWRNATVQVTGLLDTSDATLEPFINLDELTNNDTQAGKLKGLRIDRVQYSMSAGTGLEVQIKWEVGPAGGGDVLITALAGQGHDKYKKMGGLIPPMDAPGYIGNIHLYTTGFSKSAPPTGFTVTLEMVKLYR